MSPARLWQSLEVVSIWMRPQSGWELPEAFSRSSRAQVRSLAQAAYFALQLTCSRRRDCHFSDKPSPSLLIRLLKGRGVQQYDSLVRG